MRRKVTVVGAGNVGAATAQRLIALELADVVLPCGVYLEGEYGIHGVFVGVPVKLGERGVEQVIELKLTTEEQAAMQKSAAPVRELVDVLGL